MPETLFAEVALPLPISQTFIYSVPSSFKENLFVGSSVRVPFGGRKLEGYVVRTSSDYPEGLKGIKEIISVSPQGSLFDAQLFKLTKWVSDYYMAPLGEVLRAAVPGSLARKERKGIDASLSEAPPSWIAAAGQKERMELTKPQREGLELIESSLESGGFKVFLIHGVTGSGKTEIYIRAVRKALDSGGSALILLPEVSLSTQIERVFRDSFGDEVGVLHSYLLDSERKKNWLDARTGKLRVIIGARSAVFAPLKDLKLIVVDEEHETTYKQGDSPRYNARDVAVMRAKLLGITCLLGSATPSLETYANVKKGKYTLIELPERVESRSLASVEIVDMREKERKKQKIFSELMETEVKEALARDEQVILFINRRGFSPFVQCLGCGFVVECPHCDVPLTYHIDSLTLQCHYCGYRMKIVENCSNCKGSIFRYGGVAIQKVEKEIEKLFENARLARMDLDTTRKRGAHRELFRAFEAREKNILLGTQMVTKGFDFPEVTLVGVISADTQLNLPDFRSSERTFQLLTQVAGRAGRGDKPGKVVVQTYLPETPSLVAAQKQDYAEFFEAEISERKELGYPPFSKLIEVELSGKKEELVVERSKMLGAALKEEAHGTGVEVLGPAPHPISRLKGRFRWRITLRGSSHEKLKALLQKGLAKIEKKKFPSSLRLTIDVDPL
ncbi:MAG: primosomal protein N' [Candidatus Eisenbacteria bacterium]|nr:primosomal protein N' [Candidatus Eisenbacteria bacterium]